MQASQNTNQYHAKAILGLESKVCDLLSVVAYIPKFEAFSMDPLANELLVHLRTDLKYHQKTTFTNVNEANMSLHFLWRLRWKSQLCKITRNDRWRDWGEKFSYSISVWPKYSRKSTSLETNPKRKNSEIEGQKEAKNGKKAAGSLRLGILSISDDNITINYRMVTIFIDKN